MNKEQAIKEINKAFEPSFANYIITALTDGATVSDKVSEQEPCEDAVSRKAVLNLAKDLEFKGVKGLEHYKHRCIEIEDVEDLPSVTPELSSLREMNDALKKRVEFLENMIRYASAPTKKVGKWIAQENIHGLERYYKCSNCGSHCLYEYIEIGFQNAKTKYCPKCGAEMEVEK